MSYFKKTEYKIETKIDSRIKSKTEYEIIPGECFPVVRNCSGCGQKSHFVNTKKFRVNANGGKADVWLIYQCENCRHTLNLTIYERLKVSSIPEEEYKCFLDNDEELAEKYGKDIQFFRKNRAEVDFERLPYEIVLLHNTKENVGNAGESIDNSAESIDNAEEPYDYAKEEECKTEVNFTIKNPWKLKIRPEKQIAEAFNLSRSQVKKLMLQDRIKVENISSEMICGIIQFP